MSNILSPQGFEPNEDLQDSDIQEVFQGSSGGIRRNKQVTLASLKAFFRKLTTFTPNNIVESDGTGNLRTTSITTNALTASITNTDANTSNLTANVNQGVKTTDIPIFAGAGIDGHDVPAELSVLNLRVDQDVRQAARPTFADVNITGLTGTVESRIETNTSNISGNDADISNLSDRISDNDNDISTLQTKTPQSYKTTDDVTFNSINTGYGANEVVAEDYYSSLRYPQSLPQTTYGTAIPALQVKQTGHISLNNISFSEFNLHLPSDGYYSYVYTHWDSSVQETKSLCEDSKSGGSTILALGNDDQVTITYRRIS